MKFTFLLFAASVGAPSYVVAQTSVVQSTSAESVIKMDAITRADARCDYNTCALRLKSTAGPWKIARGSNEQEVGTLGLLRPPHLASLVADVPDAAAEARAAEHSYRRSAATLWGGSALAVVGVLFSAGSDMHVVGTTIGAVGVAGMVIGSLQHATSIDMISKSIWLYNRALSR
ncbi:MAG TPA: hypothetical protein VM099_07870 [Gemmatimonadaceae bacterium]|nr:hypothetical protein [Gemmatimonadaceae bacterium]